MSLEHEGLEDIYIYKRTLLYISLSVPMEKATEIRCQSP